MDSGRFTQIVRPTVLSRKNYNKIFCIGENKTGTTTLEHVLKIYGFNLPLQQEQEVRLTKQCFSTNYQGFKEFVSKYDAFQDLPFSQGQTYVVADAIFTNSRFILTERNPEDWFNSLVNFHKKIFKINDLSSMTESDVINRMDYLYPGYAYENISRKLFVSDDERCFVDWGKLYDKDYYIDQYLRRNLEVKRYFMNSPEKLLVIDLSKEYNTGRLCNFLGLPEEYIVEFPRINKT